MPDPYEQLKAHYDRINAKAAADRTALVLRTTETAYRHGIRTALAEVEKFGYPQARRRLAAWLERGRP